MRKSKLFLPRKNVKTYFLKIKNVSNVSVGNKICTKCLLTDDVVIFFALTFEHFISIWNRVLEKEIKVITRKRLKNRFHINTQWRFCTEVYLRTAASFLFGKKRSVKKLHLLNLQNKILFFYLWGVRFRQAARNLFSFSLLF